MTDPRKAAFSPYLRCLADMMELRDWSVRIDNGAPDNANAMAKVDTAYGRKLLWLNLSETFLDSSPEEQRQTLVHELVHAHFASMHHFLCHHLGEGPAFEAYRLAHEYGVDAIAEGWAKTLPLPGEVKAKE